MLFLREMNNYNKSEIKSYKSERMQLALEIENWFLKFNLTSLFRC